MGYLITGMLSLGALLKKNSRFVFIAFIGLLWILFAFTMGNADYNNYKSIYENIDREFILQQYYEGLANESGFRLLYQLFHWIGFSYEMFLLIFSLAGLYLLSKVVWKYSMNPNVVMVLYLLHPFAIDTIQLRSFMAMAIVIYCLQYLVDGDRWGIQKYLIGVLIASTIHVSAIFYVILILIKFFNVRQCLWLALLGIGGILFIYLNADFIAGMLSFAIPENKMRDWLSGDMKRSLISVVSTVGLRVGWMVLLWYFYRRYKRRVRRGLTQRDYVLERLYKCNIILLVTLGFEVFVKQYERLGRITFMIGYILFTRLFELRKTRFLPWMFVFGFMGIYFIYFMFFSETGNANYFNAVFLNLFKNNKLL